MKNKKVLIALISIVIFGAFLRFYKLGENSFVADEFLDINSTFGYVQTGEWQAWNFHESAVETENAFAPRDVRAWGYKWQVAQLLRFLPPTETVVRSISAMWGVFTIILMFFVARSWTGKTGIGLLSAFLFAVSIDGIEFNRTFRMYAMFFPVFLLFSWTIFKFIESRYNGKSNLLKNISLRWGINPLFAIPAILLGLLSMHVHELTVNIAAILFLYIFVMVLLMWKRKGTLKSKYGYAMGSMIFLGLGAFIALPEKVAKYSAGLKFFEDHYSYLEKVINDYSHAILPFLFIGLGSWFLVKNQSKQKAAIWIMISFFAPLLMAIFLWNRVVGPQYIFFAQSFMIILIASGIYFLADFFKSNLRQYGLKSFYIPIILALLILPNYAYFFQDTNTYVQNSRSDNPDYRRIFTYVKKKSEPGDALITRTFRNYYFSGSDLVAYDFGGERTKEKITLDMLKQVMQKHQSGWIVYSDNDDNYISSEAEEYMQENMEKVNAIEVRGTANVYRWEIDKQ